MSPTKNKKRVSILKRRKSSVDSPEATTTNTKKKGILFSEKKTVKEFFQCDDKATIWGSSYEASIAKSDGSGDGSQRKTSLFDFSSSSIHNSNFFTTSSVAEITESEKENIVVPHLEEPQEAESRRISLLSLSTSNSSSNGSSLDNNLTVAYSEEEKKRIKKYGTDNLNITDMRLDSSLLPLDEKRVLSPRKTLYYHENSNFLVSLQEKVLQKPSEVERGSILMNISGDNISAMIFDDEAPRVKARKTIVNVDDMNLTLQNDSKPQKAAMKPSVFKIPKSPAKPAAPKALRTVAIENDMQFNSPPIKHPKLQDPKHTSEDFLDFLVSDTPTKNLCNNMCLSKKHKITPAQSPPNSKCARPPSDLRSLQVMSQLGNADSANNSIDMLKNMGLEFAPASSSQKKKVFDMTLDTSAMELEAEENQKRKSLFSEEVDETLMAAQSNSRSSVRQTLFENSISIEEPAEVLRVSQQARKTVFEEEMDVSMTENSKRPEKTSAESRETDDRPTDTKTSSNISFETSAMQLETENDARKTIFDNKNVNETLNEKPKTVGRPSVRQTLFEDNISIEEAAEIPRTTSIQSRKTIYDGGMDLSMTEVSKPQQQKSFFIDDRSNNGSKAAALSMTRSEPPRQSTASSDASTRFEDPDTPKTSCSVLMNISNSTDVLETTTELQAKANRLLQNPMATTASTSNLFTKSFQQDMDETGVSQKATPLHNSMPGGDQKRQTIYDQNMSLNMSSTNETNHLPANKSKKSSLMLGSMISLEDVNISGIEPTQEIVIKPRKTVFDGSMEEENFKPPAVVRKRSSKPRETILGSHPMDTSVNEKKRPTTRASARVTTYQSESIDETMVGRHSMDTSGAEDKMRVTKSSRMTIYNSEPVDETMVGEIETPIAMKGRITIYEDASITEELNADRQPAMVEELPASKSRTTTFDVSMDEEAAINSLPKLSPIAQFYLKTGNKSSEEITRMRQSLFKGESKTQKVRQTIYEPAAMEESIVTEVEVPEVRDAVVNRSMPSGSAFARPFLEVAKQADLTRFSDCEQRSMSPNALFSPPPGFQTPTLTDPVSFGASKLVHSDSPIEDFKLPSCKSASTSTTAVESTFVVKHRDDSRRLMNITDADLSLLDDESDPCMQESETSDRRAMRSSFNANTSLYYEALQEFVNITLKNTSISVGSTSELPKAQDLDFSTSVDYCQLLEDQINNRKTMSIKQQPKLEIDTFLESLNIRPVVIPRKPQMQADYLQKKLAESSEKHRRKLSEQRAKWNAQLPAIPSGDFLMKNYIECMDDEIKRQKESDMLGIMEVFPESRDFDFLLKNKFETDPFLSEFWKLDLHFAHMNQYKLCHKQLSTFTINFTVQNPTDDLNDLSIPIYFENVFLYVSPNSRKNFTLHNRLLMSTFKREICTDNLTSQCPSMTELPGFLDLYHARASKTVQLVENFFRVVLKHKAVIKRHENGAISVIQRYFNRRTREIAEITIAIGENIEDISIKDVQVEGLGRLTYHPQPRPAIMNMSGLMLLETILFDVEKFLRENTRASAAVVSV